MSNLQEASDFENNIAISARRFEESPFIERTGSPDMIRGVYAGAILRSIWARTISINIGACARRP
jgi:hypothetical protein